MKHDTAYYIAKGFDQKVAEYFAMGRKKLTAVTPLEDYRLRLVYEDGEIREYDMKPFIQPHTVFAFLQDPSVFRRVYLDENHNPAWDIDPAVDSKVVWNNKVDLSADTCYVDSVRIAGTKA